MNQMAELGTSEWSTGERIFLSHSEDETFFFGNELAGLVKPPLFILLSGELGMGKTILVRGLARGLGVPDEKQMGSPSFTLVNSYQGAEYRLHHVDLYRLDTLEEFNSIGLFDLMEDDTIVCVEWGEKVRPWIARGLEIGIEDLGGEDRRLIGRSFGLAPEGDPCALFA